MANSAKYYSVCVEVVATDHQDVLTVQALQGIGAPLGKPFSLSLSKHTYPLAGSPHPITPASAAGDIGGVYLIEAEYKAERPTFDASYLWPNEPGGTFADEQYQLIVDANGDLFHGFRCAVKSPVVAYKKQSVDVESFWGGKTVSVEVALDPDDATTVSPEGRTLKGSALQGILFIALSQLPNLTAPDGTAVTLFIPKQPPKS